MTPSQIINNTIQASLENVHTATIGIIQSYDSSTGKATIQPAINKQFTTGAEPMPLLYNVPIIFPRSQNFTMSFPISIGDYVLVIFCERSIDLWKSVGGQVNPNDVRKFDLSDGVAIPGILPFSSTQPNPIGTDFVISFGGSEIRISPSGAIQIKTGSTVAIGNPITELLDVVSQILSYISNPVGVNVPSVPFVGPLVDAAAAAALKIQLDLIKGTIT